MQLFVFVLKCIRKYQFSEISVVFDTYYTNKVSKGNMSLIVYKKKKVIANARKLFNVNVRTDELFCMSLRIERYRKTWIVNVTNSEYVGELDDDSEDAKTDTFHLAISPGKKFLIISAWFNTFFLFNLIHFSYGDCTMFWGDAS